MAASLVSPLCYLSYLIRMVDHLPTGASIPSTQKALLLKRDERLRARFQHLYKTKRLRLDDVLAKLETEFFISQRTIRGILKQTPNG